MNRRVIGLFLVLLLLGAGAGYAWAAATTEPPARFDAAEPVPASSPRFPAGHVEVLPDPTSPPMPTALELDTQKVGNKAFGVDVGTPVGWLRTDPDFVESKWNPPALPLNTYFLRVKLITSLRLSVQQARDARIAALREVVDELEVETQTDDTFVATYVSEDHRRLAMERFLSLDGAEDPTDPAFVTVVVVGRLTDRDGLADLLDRVTESIVRRTPVA
ncbi:hypothetical protein [Nocardioides dilutus]